jgi:Xaa-Pro dipeptidase
MAENKIDAICLAGGTSLNYFSGARWGNSERLFMMIVPGARRRFLCLPGFEEDRAREQIAAGPVTDAHVYTWQEDESPYALAAFGLKEAGLVTGKIGIEETTPFVFADSIAKAAPGGHRDQRHAGYIRVPHDQEPGRDGAAAPGFQRDPSSL